MSKEYKRFSILRLSELGRQSYKNKQNFRLDRKKESSKSVDFDDPFFVNHDRMAIETCNRHPVHPHTQTVANGYQTPLRLHDKNVSIKLPSVMSETKPPSKQVRTYQPTYQLNPRRRFNPENIEKILQRIIDYELAEVEYSEKAVPELTLSLAETVKNAIKEENYDRCRIIVIVTIGQRRQQGVHMFHSFLWDYERDAFVTYNFENCHLFANVVVYGVYLD